LQRQRQQFINAIQHQQQLFILEGITATANDSADATPACIRYKKVSNHFAADAAAAARRGKLTLCRSSSSSSFSSSFIIPSTPQVTLDWAPFPSHRRRLSRLGPIQSNSSSGRDWHSNLVHTSLTAAAAAEAAVASHQQTWSSSEPPF
jgi:hypothetical protein